MIPDARPGVSPYRPQGEIYTNKETKARIWDSRLPGNQDGVLDDARLREKLANLASALIVAGGLSKAPATALLLDCL